MSYGHAVDLIDIANARRHALACGTFRQFHRFADGTLATAEHGRAVIVAELDTNLATLGLAADGEMSFTTERRGAGAVQLCVTVAIRDARTEG